MNWYDDLEEAIAALDHSVQFHNHGELKFMSIEGSFLVINLLSWKIPVDLTNVLKWQSQFSSENKHLINLWEDVWLTRKVQVIHRLKSLLGLNHKIFGRKTILRSLTQIEADHFLNHNHLQGSAKARYKFGLIYEGGIVAVASFSGTRKMNRQGPDYISAELIRFATKNGYTVVGGLTKLIKYFTGVTKPNDVMSYADRDWSMGAGYHSSGFVLDKTTDAQEIWLNIDTLKRVFYHRLPIDIIKDTNDISPDQIETFLCTHRFRKVFNTGNLKYKLFL